jgi:hypothetical protein
MYVSDAERAKFIVEKVRLQRYPIGMTFIILYRLNKNDKQP